MTRRASFKSAPKASVLSPFCLSTLCAICCDPAPSEREFPSAFFADCAGNPAEPPNTKATHKKATARSKQLSMPTPAFHEARGAATRAQFGERARQFRHDRCKGCARRLSPKHAKTVAGAPLAWNMPRLQRRQLTTQRFARARGELAHVGLKIFITGVSAFACCCAVRHNALQPGRMQSQCLYAIHGMALKSPSCLRNDDEASNTKS